MQFQSFDWLSGCGIQAIIPCPRKSNHSIGLAVVEYKPDYTTPEKKQPLNHFWSFLQNKVSQI